MLVGMMFSVPAFAEKLIVKDHVTLREGPSRSANILGYPVIGTVFDLLDDGQQVRGYFHVIGHDGRRGWVYRRYVRRETSDIEALATRPTMAVHFIDVDQGNAALIEFTCAAILIDAGGRGDIASDHLITYLDAFFARRTDLGKRLATIFVTHTHVDHNSNLRRISERYKVGGYVHNGILNGSGRAGANWMRDFTAAASPPIANLSVENPMIEAAGNQGMANETIDAVKCANADPGIRVLSGGFADNPGWPDGEFDNGNNHSLVIRIDFGQASFLFTGDLEETAIETLIDRYAGTAMLDVDLYEVGHHGSHNGTTKPLLDAMTPEIAVISMGHEDPHLPWTAWAYGHPRRDVVTLLAAAVSRTRSPAVSVRVGDKVKRFSGFSLTRSIYATGWDGDVTVTADTQGIRSVKTGE